MNIEMYKIFKKLNTLCTKRLDPSFSGEAVVLQRRM